MVAKKEITGLILIICLCKICISHEYTLDNSKSIFENFKQKYNKVYGNTSVELEHFNIFVPNLNEIAKLNEASDNVTFVVNRFADLNPTEGEGNALHIKPYDQVSASADYNVESQITQTTRGSVESQTKHYWTSSELYDLDDSENLYKEYLKKFKDKKYKKKFERLKHYYSFVKTLATINREKRQGGKIITQMDENADQLQEPLEYMY